MVIGKDTTILVSDWIVQAQGMSLGEKAVSILTENFQEDIGKFLCIEDFGAFQLAYTCNSLLTITRFQEDCITKDVFLWANWSYTYLETIHKPYL